MFHLAEKIICLVESENNPLALNGTKNTLSNKKVHDIVFSKEIMEFVTQTLLKYSFNVFENDTGIDFLLSDVYVNSINSKIDALDNYLIIPLSKTRCILGYQGNFNFSSIDSKEGRFAMVSLINEIVCRDSFSSIFSAERSDEITNFIDSHIVYGQNRPIFKKQSASILFETKRTYKTQL